VDTVYMGMWRRAVFEQVGLFDEELVRNQDDELNYRIRKAAGRIVLVPTMRSAYQNRRTVVGLARQYFQYGLWKVRVLQKHPRQMSWRHFVPPSFVAGLGVATAISPWVPAAQTAAMVVTALYAVLVLVLARSQHAGWLATALAFATLHVSWGLGFLCGLVKFLDRWWKPESKPPALRITGGMDPLRVQRGGHR
jgi:hypothetical protein